MLRTISNIISAELLKTRQTPSTYIGIACILLVAILVTTAYHLDIFHIVELGKNPWPKFLILSNSILAFFTLTPSVILIITSLAYIEQKADSWKLLYTLPLSRGLILFSRLIVVLLLLAIILLTLCFTLFFISLFLYWKFPETEFLNYTFNVKLLFNHLSHTYISLLGVIGFQFFLSHYFKNVITSLGIGFFGFIFGFILTAGNKKLALFNPYDFSMISQDLNMIRYDHDKVYLLDWLTNVELNSIIYFFIFILLTYLLESRRNIQ